MHQANMCRRHGAFRQHCHCIVLTYNMNALRTHEHLQRPCNVCGPYTMVISIKPIIDAMPHHAYIAGHAGAWEIKSPLSFCTTHRMVGVSVQDQEWAGEYYVAPWIT